MKTELDLIDAFEKEMRARGLTPFFKEGEGIEVGQTADGRPRRFHVVGDSKGTKNGWYILFTDGVAAGEFGSWKTGASYTWCAEDRTTLTPEENEVINRRNEEARVKREAAERERQGEAARLANLIYNDSVEVFGDDHPYLKRKGIVSHGLRSARWPVRNKEGEVFRHIDDTLIVPIMDKGGKIVSLQGIFPAVDAAFGRDKDFLLGGKKRGCFFMIGRPPPPGGNVAFCEGYATGETIHQATGWCVIVCWDAYNVPTVAEAMREALPQQVFVFCADNDRWTEKPVMNPGVTYARRAAAEVNGRVCVPEFKDLEGNPTDFNDLAQREGIEAVQAIVMPPALPIPAPDDKPKVITAPGEYVTPRSLKEFDTWTPYDDIDGKGKPLPTSDNLAELCRRTGVRIRYDVIKKDFDILVPGLATSLDNAKESSYNQLLNALHRARMPIGGFDGNIVGVGDANQYNPVATWIDSRPWDGVSRLQEFFDTVKAKKDSKLPDGGSLKELLMRKWLISAVAAAYRPNGVVARGVLTFVSKQNLGKTYWAKRLAPAELEVIADGLILNPADKDSVMSVVSKWIVELGEVDATFRKADIAALKGFISKDMDSLRRPYARTESKLPRRTVFFASVNDEQFLHDPTGNTRWWTIHAEALNNQHTIDMQQVWAEVHSLYAAGESWHLTPEELDVLNDHNKEHEAITPIHDMVDAAFDWNAPRMLWSKPMSATQIVILAGLDKPSKKDVNEAAAYVTKHYGVETKRTGPSKLKSWMMPPRARSSEAPL